MYKCIPHRMHSLDFVVFQMSNKIKMSTLNNHTLEISQRFILNAVGSV
jgi:hypothetical protein